MNKPMTTEEMFNRIQSILKEKGKLPDILDYGLATYTPVPITTYEFDLRSKLAYGGNRGFIWISGLSILPTKKSRGKILELLRRLMKAMK